MDQSVRSKKPVPQTRPRLRGGVVGVGHFGRYHARKFARHEGVQLLALADHNPSSLVDIAAECSAQAYTDHADLLGQVDIVAIATPARSHAEIAAAFLEAGAHVLIEKPIATRLDEADALMKLAAKKKLVVQVGHQERAILERAGLFQISERPRVIDCVRKGPYSGRGLDVDAVLDLMSHDLDMVHALNPANIRDVSGQGTADAVDAHLMLEDGCRISLAASRVHDARERTMRIGYSSGFVDIDFIARTIRNGSSYTVLDPFAADATNGDPMDHALDCFLRAIVEGSAPLVSASEARQALDSALRVSAALIRPARAG